MTRQITRMLALFVLIGLIAVAVAASGCAGPKDSSVLSGKDIFDPAKFSMARYTITENTSGTIAHREFIVTTGKKEQDGDRITSAEIEGNSSVRTDVWINKERTATTNVRITAINSSTILITGGYPPFNMTTADKAWNPLEATYSLVGKANIECGAGKFDNCSIFETTRQIAYGDTIINTKVRYYVHPDAPVPVRYVVWMDSTTYEYDLQSAYGPTDVDSTPERVTQAFFDSLDKGDYKTAASYVVTYDSTEGKFKMLSGDAYRDFMSGTVAMYNDANTSTRVQYVLTTSTRKAGQTGGKDMMMTRWTSVQYREQLLTAFDLKGMLNFVKIGGHWKIVG